MVLPFFKVFSLVIRVFSKPVVQYAKMSSKKGEFKHKYSRRFFLFLGKKYNHWESKINQKLLNNGDDYFVKKISDEIAIDKGIEFFYEIVLYSILIGLPCYELYQGQIKDQEKQLKLQNKLNKIDLDIEDIQQQSTLQNELITNNLQNYNKELQNILAQLQQQQTQIQFIVSSLK